VREESRPVTVTAVSHHHHTLSDTPYNLWLRGELADELGLPHDGTRVEIIAGEIVVSPGPTVGHNVIVQDISDAFAVRRATDRTFPWRCLQTSDVSLKQDREAYIPDLICIAEKHLNERVRSDANTLAPDHISLVLEVTSKSNSHHDRRPRLQSAPTKWTGYARVGIPFYLLVDRAPRAAQTVLFSRPDPATGEYEHIRVWDFGETITLPDPFAVEIDTGTWEPWLD
jgi:Uma2 family endonuclease